jgi:hypothetical protein
VFEYAFLQENAQGGDKLFQKINLAGEYNLTKIIVLRQDNPIFLKSYGY